MQLENPPKQTAAADIVAGFTIFLVVFLNLVPQGWTLSIRLVVAMAKRADFQIQVNSALISESGIVLPSQKPAPPSPEPDITTLSVLVPSRPLRLKIPAIKVDAAVELTGLTATGTMDVPKNPDDVAWFASGTRPGEAGSAVMAGHYGGKAAVFNNLYKLRPGDKLSVEDSEGIVTTFVVRANRRYNPDADASGVFSSSDGQAHLNLVTCEGDWNKSTEQYNQRLVVFTDKLTE